MLQVALTGNIASGKSTVANRWRDAGVLVIDSDALAREAVAPGTTGLDRIVRRWGDSVLTPDGSLDRAAMRSRVFTDDAQRTELEEILHPEIARLRKRLVEQAEARGDQLVISEIPLLFETGLETAFDRVVFVDATEEIRLRRLMTERSLPRDAAQAMIHAQMPAAEKIERSDIVIYNNGTVDALLDRSDQVLRELRAMADPALGGSDGQ